MKRCWIVATLMVSACAATQEGAVVKIDAAPDAPGSPDAPVVVDARPSPPDAPKPDAPLPDAAVPDAPLVMPDASVDAPVEAPADARPPDARPDAAPDAVQPDACSANVELCNYMDDNCNGVPDEGY